MNNCTNEQLDYFNKLDMDFSTQFPVLKEYTYLNTAYSGLLNAASASWRNMHDADFVNDASNFRVNYSQILEDTRKQIAQTFGAEKANTYLLHNFSAGFNVLLNGLDKQHRFLLLKEDYPSVNYPVISSGFEYTEIEINTQLEDRILQAVAQFKPSILALSIVQYISGIKIQPEFIQKLKADYPDLLIIGDATQFMGTSVFDFAKSGFDAVLGSGYKWLLGGFGNGYALFSDQFKEALYQQRKTRQIPDLPMLSGRDYLSLAFEPGHYDTLNFGTLNESIKYLNTIGFENIEAAVQSISRKAREAFYSRGLLTTEMLNRTAQSTIISLPLNAQVTAKLEEAKILCAARGSGIRFSFHFYNTENDLDKLLQVLDNR